MSQEWIQLQSRLTHDVLKNRLMPGSGRVLNILRGLVESDAAEAFRTGVEQTWREHQASFINLVQTCEQQISPRRYFESPPLVYVSDEARSWLPPLIHEIWVERFGIHQWVISGLGMIEKVETCIESISRELQTGTAHARPLIFEVEGLRRYQGDLVVHLSSLAKNAAVI
jgi:hypothetical protein